MGSRWGLRVAFILGSLVMTLLLLVYWDDVRGLSLQPLQEPKHGSHQAGPSLYPSASRAQASAIEQEARKQRVKDVCSGQGAVEFPGRTRPFEQIHESEMKHLIVDDKHQIIYCFVPKVACTNWKNVMAVLSQSMISPSTGKPYTDTRDIPVGLVHSHNFFTFSQFGHRYGSLSTHQRLLKLQHYTKFLFVRDPFVRLMSAFRDKFEGLNQEFYEKYGLIMLRRYGNISGDPPKESTEAFAAGIYPKFLQFVKYLLDPETEQKMDDDHWQQVYRLCHPCQVGYDFIGQVETKESDADHLLKLLKVDHLVSFQSANSNLTKASWEQEWFAQIPIPMRRELYKMYEADFELFGYPKPDSILNP